MPMIHKPFLEIAASNASPLNNYHSLLHSWLHKCPNFHFLAKTLACAKEVELARIRRKMMDECPETFFCTCTGYDGNFLITMEEEFSW